MGTSCVSPRTSGGGNRHNVRFQRSMKFVWMTGMGALGRRAAERGMSSDDEGELLNGHSQPMLLPSKVDPRMCGEPHPPDCPPRQRRASTSNLNAGEALRRLA